MIIVQHLHQPHRVYLKSVRMVILEYAAYELVCVYHKFIIM